MRVSFSFVPTIKQQEILADDAEIRVFLGGYGSGKTTLAAVASIIHVLQHPKTADYGNGNPVFGVIAPTSQNVRDVQLATILKLLPQGLLKRYVRQMNRIELTNGCIIQGYASKSRGWEGQNFCGVWTDEAHFFSREIFHNIMSRYARDSTARKLGRRMRLICSGLPLYSSVLEEEFASKRAGTRVYHLSSLDNPHLSKEQKQQMLLSCPADQVKPLVLGQWGSASNLVFPQFSLAKHILLAEDAQGKRNAHLPVYLGIDVGTNHSSILFAHKYPCVLSDGSQGEKVVVFDEWLANGAEQTNPDVLGAKLAALPWKGQIKGVWIDPTARIQEMNAFKKALPGVSIVQQRHKTKAENEAFGIYCVQTALNDVMGNIRLQISNDLYKNDKGLINILRKYKYKPDGRPAWSDLEGDHSSDALRYLIVGLGLIKTFGGSGKAQTFPVSVVKR